MTAFAALALSVLGFISGENAVQAADFPEKLWTASCLLPTIGIVLALLILRFYKLNDNDVQLMAKCNAGEITREEAEAQMKNRY
jgi:Na+/melibiose symporter-like transporter